MFGRPLPPLVSLGQANSSHIVDGANSSINLSHSTSLLDDNGTDGLKTLDFLNLLIVSQKFVYLGTLEISSISRRKFSLFRLARIFLVSIEMDLYPMIFSLEGFS